MVFFGKDVPAEVWGRLNTCFEPMSEGSNACFQDSNLAMHGKSAHYAWLGDGLIFALFRVFAGFYLSTWVTAVH
jgi:hypothetical protein